MGSMPESIAKGHILRKLETVLNHRPNRQRVLNKLLAPVPAPLLTLAATNPHNLKLTAGEEYHVREEWLIKSNWLTQPAEPIARQGLVEALKRAMPQDLDIDFYWICGGAAPPGGKPLEVFISTSTPKGPANAPHQVTVIFLTPSVPWPPPPPGQLQKFEDIVAVKPGGTGDPVVVQVPY